MIPVVHLPISSGGIVEHILVNLTDEDLKLTLGKELKDADPSETGTMKIKEVRLYRSGIDDVVFSNLVQIMQGAGQPDGYSEEEIRRLSTLIEGLSSDKVGDTPRPRC